MAYTIEERAKAMLSHSTDMKPDDMVTIKEVLSTADASILVPQVIVGVMREAAEPIYIGSKLLQRIDIQGPGRIVTIPVMGEIRAHDVAEEGPYTEESLDFGLQTAHGAIKVGKTGLKVSLTDEMVEESQWDVVGIMLRKAGRAMARLKEEKIFEMFGRQGHPLYDNSIINEYPQAQTTGRDFYGQYNNTLSTLDFVEMVLAVMMSGFVPTDVLMPTLAWLVFAKNELLGQLPFGALGGTPGQIQISPNSVQGRVPMPLEVNLSPFIRFDRTNMLYDMYVLDRNEVGLMVVKEDISVEKWADLERDIQNIKVKERYGCGMLNNGMGVAVAKNLAFQLSYELPHRLITMDAANVSPAPSNAW